MLDKKITKQLNKSTPLRCAFVFCIKLAFKKILLDIFYLYYILILEYKKKIKKKGEEKNERRCI
ncbi:hypothetical protein AS161_05440 [Fervidobacterium sp. 2310opik-2]|nr:hypothetical protein AS161_05440 [Fervidobacterium sp. 2310opik-2]